MSSASEISKEIARYNPYPMEGNFYSWKNQLYRYDGATWNPHTATTIHVGKSFVRLPGESMSAMIERIAAEADEN